LSIRGPNAGFISSLCGSPESEAVDSESVDKEAADREDDDSEVADVSKSFPFEYNDPTEL